jgi:hypothetical protein
MPQKVLKRLAMYFEEGEYEEVVRVAGDEPLARFCRKIVLRVVHEASGGNREVVVPESGGEVESSSIKRRSVREVPSGPICKHGTSKGYRCWQCGGRAVVE